MIVARPSQRHWSGFYPYDIRFHDRVAAKYWYGAEKPKILRGQAAQGHDPARGARHQAPLALVLTRPSRCPELGETVFYGKVAFSIREKARFMKEGELYSYFHPSCALVKPDPVGSP